MRSRPNSYSTKGDAETLLHTIVNYWAARGHVMEIGEGKDIWLERIAVSKSEGDHQLGKGEFHWLIRSTMLNGFPRQMTRSSTIRQRYPQPR